MRFCLPCHADSKKLKTERNVESFTATCSGSQQSMVAASLSRVTRLVEGVCDDVELPPPPICPNLPVDQQHCSVGAAFSCIIHFNTDLLSQGPSLLWRDWCTYVPLPLLFTGSVE